MFEDVKKIEQLDKFVKTKEEEIEPIKNQIATAFRHSESLKSEIVDKCIKRGKRYYLNTPVSVYGMDITHFEIISYDDIDYSYECILGRYEPDIDSPSEFFDFLKHSDIYRMFLETKEVRILKRKEKLNSVLENE